MIPALPSSHDASCLSDATSSPSIRPTPLSDILWPACFSNLRPHRPLDVATIADCYLALRRLEADGGVQTRLRERLFEGIALASKIRGQLGIQHRPGIDAVRQFLVQDEPHPTTPRPPGMQLAFNWVAVLWERLASAPKAETHQKFAIVKPVPVAGEPVTETLITLPLRLVVTDPRARAAIKPGTLLAASVSLTTQDRPRLELRIGASGDLTLKIAPAAPSDARGMLVAQLQEAIEVGLLKALRKDVPLRSGIAFYNEWMHRSIKHHASDWRLNVNMNSVAVNHGMELLAERYSGVESLARFDYAMLADGSRLLEALTDCPGAQEAIKAARDAARPWEALARTKTLPTSQPPTSIYRSAVVRGGIVQLLMEKACQMEIAVSASEGGAFSPRWHFRTPIERLLPLLHPTERLVLETIRTDLASVAETAPMDGDATSFEWPDISMDTAVPRACLHLTMQAESAAARPVSSDSIPRWYRGPALLRSPVFDDIQPLNSQPAWLSKVAPAPLDADGQTHEPAAVHPWQDLLPTQEVPEGPEDAGHYDALMDRAIEEIRTPGEWATFSAELAPRIIVDCPGWPPGRALEILNWHNGDLLSYGGKTTAGSSPVVVVLDLASSHYMPLVDHQVLESPHSGDCFYYSVLTALGQDDRRGLLQTASLADGDIADASLTLRKIFADFIDTHRERYRRHIQLMHTIL